MSLLRPSTRALSYQSVWGIGGIPENVGTVETAMRLIPLYSATTGIASDCASLPWHSFRDTGKGYGVKLDIQPRLLTDPAGDGSGLIPWLNAGFMSALLWGFAFAPVLSTGRDGWPAVARWVHPNRVQIDETGPMPVFSVDGKVIPTGGYIYVPGPALPGCVRGLSPITLFRLQFGKALTAQRYASDLYTRGVMPPGILQNTRRTLLKGAATAAKSQFRAAVADREILVTGADWKWTQLEVPADDAKFLETIKAGANEIAAIYHVEPEEIGGEAGSSLTYATEELNQIKRQRRALLPWVRRFEAALTNALPRPQYVKANLDASIRVDLKGRMEAHEIALRIGLETNEEGRMLEDKAPLNLEQIDTWQNLYRPNGGQPTTTATTGGK